MQTLFCKPPACHAEPQHMLCAASLDIAAKAAGKLFIVGGRNFSLVEL